MSARPEHSALLYERRDDLQGSDSLSEIARRVGPGSTVLDLGAATGALGRRLREAGCTVDGVEHDAQAAAQARPFYRRLLELDLDRADLREQFPHAAYDVVVCADVLEHLRDPAGALATLRRALAREGQVVISMPNVAHLWMRLSLLAGRFEYAERGILDRTHLRFYTRRTLTALVRGAGLRIARLTSTPVPLYQLVPTRWHGRALAAVHALSAHTARALPRLLAYQFVVGATHDRER